MRSPLHALILGASLATCAGTAAAGDIYVICSPGVTLTPADVHDVFLGEKGFAGSVKLVPADNSAAQADFLDKVLKLDAAKYTGIWTKKSFRDGANSAAREGQRRRGGRLRETDARRLQLHRRRAALRRDRRR